MNYVLYKVKDSHHLNELIRSGEIIRCDFCDIKGIYAHTSTHGINLRTGRDHCRLIIPYIAGKNKVIYLCSTYKTDYSRSYFEEVWNTNEVYYIKIKTLYDLKEIISNIETTLIKMRG